MRAPAISPASRPLRGALASAALMLAVTLSTAAASADESTAEPQTIDGTATLASALGDAETQADGLSAEGAPTLASYLASGELQLSVDMALSDDPEPVVGSFTVDGLTYAVVGEGEVALVAVAPSTLVGGLAGDPADDVAGGSADDPSDGSSGAEGAGRGIGSGVPTSPQPLPAPSAEADGAEEPVGTGLARIAGSAAAGLLEGEAAGPDGVLGGPLAGSMVPQGEEEGTLSGDVPNEAPDDGPDAEAAPNPSILALPEAVEHDGISYALVAVGSRALAGCGATTVVVPASVASVDESAFSGSSVQAIEVAPGNPTYSSYDGMLFDADRTSLLLIPEGKQGAARIPKEAASVPPDAFSHSASVTSVSVEAGSAAYSSRNGCLYDVTGTVLFQDRLSLQSDGDDDVQVNLIEGETWQIMCVSANGGALAYANPPHKWSGNQYWGFPNKAPGDSVLLIPRKNQLDIISDVGDTGKLTRSVVPDPALTTNYLVGWSLNRVGKAWLTDGSGHTSATWGSGRQHIYALWAVSPVEFDANGGEGGQTSNVTAKYGEAMPTISTTAPRKTGYTFLGWYTTKANSSEEDKFYDASGKSAQNWPGGTGGMRPTTLYANWTPVVSKVTLDPTEDASSAGTPAVYLRFGDGFYADEACGEKVASVTAPKRTGHAFTGYYWTEPSGRKTQRIDKDGKIMTSNTAWTGPVTLVAEFEPVVYAIDYDLAGGELAEGTRSFYTIEGGFDLPVPTRYGYQFQGWEVTGAGEGGAIQGTGVEDVALDDGSKVTRVKSGTYGDLSCTARWALRYDLDVPVCAPGEVTFEADSLTGQVRVAAGSSATGEIRSFMAEPVALDELACEGLDASGDVPANGGAPELEAIFGAGSAAKVRFTATLGQGPAAATHNVSSGDTASLAAHSIPAATSAADPGRLPVTYGLELDPDLRIPPVRDAAPVARLTYTVSLP